MRTTTIAACLLAACLPLTACAGSEEPAAEKPPAASSQPEEPAAEPAPKELTLGKPAETVGDSGTGELEVTPTTVVYVDEGGGETPEHGRFAVVTVKDKATSAVAAAEAPPASGGGWAWIAPDGQSVDSGGGTSFNVVLDSFNNAGEVQPGSFTWNAVVFDLTEKQAAGGTLVYTDGNGTTHRWKVPAEDTGPQIEQVKEELEF